MICDYDFVTRFMFPEPFLFSWFTTYKIAIKKALPGGNRRCGTRKRTLGIVEKTALGAVELY